MITAGGIQKCMQADEKFHQAGCNCAAWDDASVTRHPSRQGRVANCNDYHVGRFSACRPPDDD